MDDSALQRTDSYVTYGVGLIHTCLSIFTLAHTCGSIIPSILFATSFSRVYKDTLGKCSPTELQCTFLGTVQYQEYLARECETNTLASDLTRDPYLLASNHSYKVQWSPAWLSIDAFHWVISCCSASEDAPRLALVVRHPPETGIALSPYFRSSIDVRGSTNLLYKKTVFQFRPCIFQIGTTSAWIPRRILLDEWSWLKLLGRGGDS